MLIIASKPGQLGNRLFLFAHFVGFSAEQNIPVANPAFDEYANYFEGTRKDLFCRYPQRLSLLPERWRAPHARAKGAPPLNLLNGVHVEAFESAPLRINTSHEGVHGAPKLLPGGGAESCFIQQQEQ